MKCNVCDTEIKDKRKYDNHVKNRFHIKPLVKKFLSLVDFLIPSAMIRLKRISSVKRGFFKGYIGICSNCGHGQMMTSPTKKTTYSTL